jgi:polyisoprenoid-binding protein YceI
MRYDAKRTAVRSGFRSRLVEATMSVSQLEGTPTADLPEGTWHVDPTASTLTFSSRGVFGLVPVHGTFGAYEGELEVHGRDAHGELRIHAATLDTKNEKRDTHLRSADFFHVTEHPTVTFSLIELGPSADGTLSLHGTLRIRDNELRFQAPVHASRLGADRLRLDTKVSVDRAAAGVGWSKMGMIRGKAHLGASIVLVCA